MFYIIMFYICSIMVAVFSVHQGENSKKISGSDFYVILWKFQSFKKIEQAWEKGLALDLLNFKSVTRCYRYTIS